MQRRWEGLIEGKVRRAPGGMYDTYIELAAWRGWTQPMVDACDADYIDELLIFLQADAAVRKRQRE